MLISDLTYLEETSENIEGAGFARLYTTRTYTASGQMDVEVDIDENADVNADTQPRYVRYSSFASIYARV
jgi:hypothetical protein